MKTIKILLASLLVSFVFTSCKDEVTDVKLADEKNKTATIEDYLNFLNTPTDGSIIIQSFETNLSNGQSYLITSSLSGDQKPLNMLLNEMNVNFYDYSYVKSTDKSYSYKNDIDVSELFGKKFDLTIDGNAAALKSSQNQTDTIDGVYIPELIHIQFTGLQEGKIVEGTIINWNFDGLNQNGVVIAFEYNPFSQYEGNISAENPERYLNGITITDNGSYTITAADLQYLPNNAVISVYVGRAGYSITSYNNGSDENSYAVAGYTVSRSDFVIEK